MCSAPWSYPNTFCAYPDSFRDTPKEPPINPKPAIPIFMTSRFQIESNRKFASAPVPEYLPPYRPISEYTSCPAQDRKSTRLNSSHVKISYAVFCLKKKIGIQKQTKGEYKT